MADGAPSTTFGTLLRHYRRHAELTQEELAERAGLSTRAISDLERGLKRSPHEGTIEMLAEALQLSPEDRLAFKQAVSRKRNLPAGPTPRAVRLPAEPTPFIGREREEGQALRLLRWGELRLLTLTGPGGVGKTRLALRVAATMAAEFSDGVVFVSLTPADGAERVLALIASALDLREDRDRTMLDLMAEHLGTREMLLVLDNFEHVLESAPDVAELLAAAPQLRILATSRERLHLRSEQELGVPPLDLPPETNRSGARALQRYPALALFMERAHAVRPDFDVDDDGARIVARICRRLDGLPLAIELAAARIRHAEPATLLEQLNHQLSVLTDGPVDLPLRHQTIRNTIRWSYDLLTEDEQRALRHLAVCVGGCDQEGAEVLGLRAIAGGASEPWRTLSALVDKNLLRRLEGATGVRYTMLETLREFALEELVSQGESASAGCSHAQYFTAVARQAREARTGPDRSVWVARLEVEHDNMRAALRFCRDSGDLEQATLLAGLLSWFWEARGHVREGEAWLEELLNAGGDRVAAEARAPAMLGASRAAAEHRDMERARTRGEGALAAFREANDPGGVALALNNLGALAHASDFAAAQEYFRESLALYRSLGDQWGMTQVLMNSGVTASVHGKYATATRLYEEALPLARLRGDSWHEAMILLNLAEMEQRQGNFERAARLNGETIALKRAIGDHLGVAIAQANLGGDLRMLRRPREALEQMREALRYFGGERITVRIVGALGGVSLVAHDLGLHEQATLLLGAFDQLCHRQGLPVPPDTRAVLDPIPVVARASLGDLGFETALRRGREMPMDEAIALALGLGL